MANRERRKGLDGEREVAAVWQSHGFDVRGLEGKGDHTVVRDRQFEYGREITTIHSEVKRTETAHPWAWYEQAFREAPAGAVPVVTFRRSRSPWLALIALEDLARLLT